MSNRSTHLAGAALVVNTCEGLSLYLEKKQGQDINILTVIKSLSIANISGALGAVLPDILDPPTDWRHRKFFHSVVMAVALVIFLVLLYKKQVLIENEDLKRFLKYLGIGYGVHLVQDACTPMGLPLI